VASLSCWSPFHHSLRGWASRDHHLDALLFIRPHFKTAISLIHLNIVTLSMCPEAPCSRGRGPTNLGWNAQTHLLDQAHTLQKLLQNLLSQSNLVVQSTTCCRPTPVTARKISFRTRQHPTRASYLGKPTPCLSLGVAVFCNWPHPRVTKWWDPLVLLPLVQVHILFGQTWGPPAGIWFLSGLEAVIWGHSAKTEHSSTHTEKSRTML